MTFALESQAVQRGVFLHSEYYLSDYGLSWISWFCNHVSILQLAIDHTPARRSYTLLAYLSTFLVVISYFHQSSSFDNAM